MHNNIVTQSNRQECIEYQQGLSETDNNTAAQFEPNISLSSIVEAVQAQTEKKNTFSLDTFFDIFVHKLDTRGKYIKSLLNYF